MAAPIRQRLTPKKRLTFLDALAQCGNVTQAAKTINVSRPTLYDHRKADSDFAAAWDAAAELGAEALEDEARRRAYEGVEKPLTCAKGLIYRSDGTEATVREYSDTLLIFLLKGARPEKYRDNVKVSGTVEHSIVPTGTAAAVAAALLADVRELPDTRAALAAHLLAGGD